MNLFIKVVLHDLVICVGAHSLKILPLFKVFLRIFYTVFHSGYMKAPQKAKNRISI
jgi:hypothetical protein